MSLRMPNIGTGSSGASSAQAVATGLGTAVLGPLGGIAGNIIGGLFGRSGQKSANAQNLAIAREQMSFQERMSNTAYRRAARDLEGAGLNRILALGSPASTPAGAKAEMQNVNAPLADSISNGVNTALSAVKLRQEVKESNARIRVADANAGYIQAKTGTEGPRAALLREQVRTELDRRVNIRTSTEKTRLDNEIKTLTKSRFQSADAFFNDIMKDPLRNSDYWLQQAYKSNLGFVQKWVLQLKQIADENMEVDRNRLDSLYPGMSDTWE